MFDRRSILKVQNKTCIFILTFTLLDGIVVAVIVYKTIDIKRMENYKSLS
jgi:uncharacterized membrane protein